VESLFLSRRPPEMGADEEKLQILTVTALGNPSQRIFGF